MTVRRITVVIGLLAMLISVLQVFQPRAFWSFWEGHLYERQVTLYALGIISFFLGLFLLYVGLRKLTLFSTLIWIIGVLSLISGLIMLVSPEFFLDLLSALFYARSDGTMLTISYISGVIRFLLGALILIAGLSPKPTKTKADTGSETKQDDQPISE